MGQDSSIELVITQIGPVVTAFSRLWEPDRNFAECQLVNDHAVAHLQANPIPWKWIWLESVQQLWSYSICKTLGVRQGFQQWPYRPMTMLLHIYGPRWFHRTSEDATWSCNCGVTVSTRNWVPDRNAQVR